MSLIRFSRLGRPKLRGKPERPTRGTERENWRERSERREWERQKFRGKQDGALLALRGGRMSQSSVTYPPELHRVAGFVSARQAEWLPATWRTPTLFYVFNPSTCAKSEVIKCYIVRGITAVWFNPYDKSNSVSPVYTNPSLRLLSERTTLLRLVDHFATLSLDCSVDNPHCQFQTLHFLRVFRLWSPSGAVATWGRRHPTEHNTRFVVVFLGWKTKA